MKKILTLLGTITLIGTSTTSLVDCKPQYSEEQLKELKEENKISINDNTLEWMAPQEKPFNKIDNKWYFVIWRGDKGHDWRIAKFKNDEKIIPPKYEYRYKEIDRNGKEILQLRYFSRNNTSIDLIYFKFPDTKILKNNDNIYFKAVYRWYGDGEPNTPIIDSKTGKVTDLNKAKEVKKNK